ncbi:MAG: ferritin family protein [Candidatus Geothermincolia bacterium]
MAEAYHEPLEGVPEAARDHHRAIVSLVEELQAVDWYNQRITASSNPELKEILAHNRDEEKEHAAMLLEWLRRNDDALGPELRKHLFSEGPIRD